MPSPKRQPKQPHIAVKFTVKEAEALDKAVCAFRRRTGEDMDRSKALRDNGAREFCEREGVKWPKEDGR